MADRARTFFPIAVDFAEGELPSNVKLNGLSRQARQGLSIAAYMIGDAWNQSGDSIFQGEEEARTLIPNLSRYIGATRLLNPRIPELPDIQEYTHQLTAYAGKREMFVPFPVASGTPTWSGTGAPSGSPESSAGDVDSGGKWWINTATGRIITYDECQADWQITYVPVVTSDLGEDATWNIIPDPDLDPSWSFRSVKIEYKNGNDDSEGYLIYLPPRGPLNTRRLDNTPQDNIHAPAHEDNYQNNPSGPATRRFWQDPSVDADTGTDAAHYRHNLPKLLTDAAGWGQAATIPAGFLYLYDPNDTGTILEGITFSAENATTPRTWVLRASGANLTTWLQSTHGKTQYPESRLKAVGDHDSDHYPTNGLSLITVGVSLSDAFSALLSAFLNHDHGVPSSPLTQPVSHNNLAETFDPTADTTQQLDPSGFSNDAHPQYLHRAGYNLGRDKYGNAMLGDLVLASTSSNTNYLNDDNDSYGIYFGSPTEGAKLYFNYTTGAVELNTQGRAVGLSIKDPSLNNVVNISNSEASAESYIAANNKLNIQAEDIVIESDIVGSTGILARTTQNGDITISAQGPSPSGNKAYINLLAKDGIYLEAVNENISISAPNCSLSTTGNLTIDGVYKTSANETSYLISLGAPLYTQNFTVGINNNQPHWNFNASSFSSGRIIFSTSDFPFEATLINTGVAYSANTMTSGTLSANLRNHGSFSGGEGTGSPYLSRILIFPPGTVSGFLTGIVNISTLIDLRNDVLLYDIQISAASGNYIRIYPYAFMQISHEAISKYDDRV